jgi:Effector Associated Constant Component 1/Putative prokaryotic signal transducing protein
MSELVEAARVGSTVEAQLIVGMLDGDGIHAIVSADDAGGLEPQLQVTDGVRVLVARPDLAAARALISEANAVPRPGGRSQLGTELVVHAWSGRFSDEDDRWRQQVGDLHREMLSADVGAAIHRVPEPESKGTIDQLVVALGSAGVFTTAVEVIRAWLARDGSRNIRLDYFEDGSLHSLELTGSRLDDETLRRLQALTEPHT